MTASTRSLLALAQRLCAPALQFVQAHPRRILAGVAAVLLGTTGVATAVTTLGPDPADLPVREVVQALGSPLDLPTEAQGAALTLYRNEVSRSSDTAESLLARLGLNDAAAAAFLRNTPLVRQHLLGRAGRFVSARNTADQRLQTLVARWVADETSGQFQRLVVQRQGAGFKAQLESAPLRAQIRMSSGRIESSLFAATDAVGLPDAVASQMAEIFSGDIDFRRALRKGDRFQLVYEVLEADGEPMRTGRVLSAEFENAGKRFGAMWFQPAAGGKGGYYTLEGKSLRRAFLSSPVAFSRVSSGFSMRFHPILKTMRAHLGTDFAAPTGTPVRALADGVVSVAGWQNGYGNVVFVRHANDTETVYAHMSRLLTHKGQRVGQGETLGLVGSTGWATGPHLHLEVRVKGVQRDPMAMARSSESVPVAAADLPVFRQAAQDVRVALAQAARGVAAAID